MNTQTVTLCSKDSTGRINRGDTVPLQGGLYWLTQQRGKNPCVEFWLEDAQGQRVLEPKTFQLIAPVSGVGLAFNKTPEELADPRERWDFDINDK